jgi:hypothetical protein
MSAAVAPPTDAVAPPTEAVPLELTAEVHTDVEAWLAIPCKKCLKRAELATFAAAERTITELIAPRSHPSTRAVTR